MGGHTAGEYKFSFKEGGSFVRAKLLTHKWFCTKRERKFGGQKYLERLMLGQVEIFPPKGQGSVFISEWGTLSLNSVGQPQFLSRREGAPPTLSESAPRLEQIMGCFYTKVPRTKLYGWHSLTHCECHIIGRIFNIVTRESKALWGTNLTHKQGG